MAALAYPDRVGLRRRGEAPRYLLSGGRGADLAADDPLAGQRLIVATDLDGAGRDARIRQALPISESALRRVLGDRIAWREVCEWSRRERRVVARRLESLGAIALEDRHWPDVPPDAVARAALDGVRDLGLAACGMDAGARRLQARVELLRAQGADLPDFSDTALMDRAEDWLLPHLSGCRTAADLASLGLLDPLRAHLGWDGVALVDRLAPADFLTPLGRKVPVDYDGGQPGITVRLQEMFGTAVHPVIGPRGLPLRVTLLSPGGRPVQVTTDLPGFWDTTYSDVRKDMRGRYPRHPWPENPRDAAPTLRAKPRGT
jgi:ATP-dependent helicase HrpB